ncbi:MAG: methylenetetrahydrofolate reductase [Xanthomonadales bacterium]|nr:methylenetetrahydrofolate reductase [Xanthomonadales bacterium]
MTTHDDKGSIMAGLMRQAYLEVIPTRTILDRLVHLPRHSYLSITCSPVNGLEPTLELVEQLRALPEERQLKLIPHIAARLVRDQGHLREIMARLSDARVESIFVPGGDAAEAAGIYPGSLELLRAMAEIGHDIEDIGVAAHPEGHPLLTNVELMRLLKDKQQFATYMVTQMCFDPMALIDWLRRVRSEGVTLPAWFGLPGVAELPKLLSLSMRIGVGQSLQVLKKQKGLVRKLISAKPYQPDDLLAGLQPHLGDPALDIRGFHLFSFNNVEHTERWRTQTAARLVGG